MKKISLFALVVLAGLLFAAPALRAQEAEQTEAQKKANAIKMMADDEQLGNFLKSLDPEALAAYATAVQESGDTDLINRFENALNNLGTPADGGVQESDKGTTGASSIMQNFGDAGDVLDGGDFDTSNPVVTSVATGWEEEEEDEPWPVPPISSDAY